MSADEFIAELWGYARELPMGEHPWFQGILQHRWTREQIILGEVQHYLRVRTNPIFFGYIAVNAVTDKQYGLMEVVLENFMEELSGPRTHVDVMLQFLEEGGISREEADRAEPAPGTMAAIEMIIGCCQRSSAEPPASPTKSTGNSPAITDSPSGRLRPTDFTPNKTRATEGARSTRSGATPRIRRLRKRSGARSSSDSRPSASSGTDMFRR